jgi:23S rRNA (pseudouridine1915-N3)-methyltransferase
LRLLVVAIGRLKNGPERDLAARYRERAVALGKSLGVTACDLTEISESRACDERGRSDWPSERIAEKIGGWRDAGRGSLVLVIGGADGLHESVRGRADHILAFGAATLPHGLVRVLALEQVYRALTILAGHPYHRGDPEA